MEKFIETFWSMLLYFAIPALFALLVYLYAASKKKLAGIAECETEDAWKRSLASTVLELISIAETLCKQNKIKPEERYAYVMSKALSKWKALPASVKAKYDKDYIESLIETGVVAQGYSSTADAATVSAATNVMKELFSAGGVALVEESIPCSGEKPSG